MGDGMSRIRELREERNISQQRLAIELSTTQAMISKYELEATELSSSMLCQYSKFFGVTTDYILGLTDHKIVIEADVSDDERKLLMKYRLINNVQKARCQGYLDGLLDSKE